MSRERTCPCMENNSIEHQMVNQYIWTIKKHRMILERRIADTGVYRSQHQMLMYISDHPHASQKDLAEHHRISTATVAVTLKKLEKGGFIRREVDEQDNRYNHICLTDRGKQIVKESVGLFQEIECAMFAGFTREECEAMSRFLNRISDNLENYGLQNFETESED